MGGFINMPENTLNHVLKNPHWEVPEKNDAFYSSNIHGEKCNFRPKIVSKKC